MLQQLPLVYIRASIREGQLGFSGPLITLWYLFAPVFEMNYNTFTNLPLYIKENRFSQVYKK
ncbi:hypothetical protein CI610_03735 [invertebrate metagenome]|uniref:Uncharacterized protein n=1 Tax=invertebrate metagenome TaxID=1711999 RepID=A0A2H9T2A7_9ZZZZ